MLKKICVNQFFVFVYFVYLAPIPHRLFLFALEHSCQSSKTAAAAAAAAESEEDFEYCYIYYVTKMANTVDTMGSVSLMDTLAGHCFLDKTWEHPVMTVSNFNNHHHNCPVDMEKTVMLLL